MNSGDLLLLKEKLIYLGFGEKVALNEQLDIEIQKGMLEFQLKTIASFDEWSMVEATLFFRKSDNFDLYFFTKYDAMLYYPEGGSSGKRSISRMGAASPLEKPIISCRGGPSLQPFGMPMT
ncbi:MAG TPA: hypothetical protein VHD83_21835 [Puia sp.]|nr:hypothetical protein [Puia sp.]